MTKEKMLSLTKYANETNLKLSSKIPEKHKNREKAYREFLEKELAMTTKKIEDGKMDIPVEAKK